mmetsp:Transcript_28503/g.92389  ORF Transcript_28503/g.92389 Transcript_28503/m.92389 type:complete len:239 (-) Transcript_28503:155-871(-)
MTWSNSSVHSLRLAAMRSSFSADGGDVLRTSCHSGSWNRECAASTVTSSWHLGDLNCSCLHCSASMALSSSCSSQPQKPVMCPSLYTTVSAVITKSLWIVLLSILASTPTSNVPGSSSVRLLHLTTSDMPSLLCFSMPTSSTPGRPTWRSSGLKSRTRLLLPAAMDRALPLKSSSTRGDVSIGAPPDAFISTMSLAHRTATLLPAEMVLSFHSPSTICTSKNPSLDLAATYVPGDRTW